MRATEDISIIRSLADLIEASKLNKKCGQYSQAHPSVAVKDNPHNADATRAHRRAFGSVKVLWGCSECFVMLPVVTENARSECHDAPLFFHDFR